MVTVGHLSRYMLWKGPLCPGSNLPSFMLVFLLLLMSIVSFCRYYNNASIELHNAAREQQKITELRLLEILGEHQCSLRHQVDRRAGKLAQQLSDVIPSGNHQGNSPITTHVLDTSHGRPAAGVAIDLEYTEWYSTEKQASWTLLGHGRTNAGGRLSTLLPDGTLPKPGTYCLTFHVGEYYDVCRVEDSVGALEAFYPVAKVYFTIQPDQIHQHFHVPLTWNPYGYSTYRGS